MSQGTILLVFLGLKLLKRILFDQLLFGVHFQFQTFAVGFKLFHFGARGFQSTLRGAELPLQLTAFHGDMRQFFL
jgi:hypothetical protein